MEEYHSIKVPKWVYDNVHEGQLRLSRKGLAALPVEVLNPKNCPVCKSRLHKDRSERGREFFVCDRCGYAQQEVDVDRAGALGAGVVIGLGLACLISALTRNGAE